MDTLSLIQPDDWHVHLREDEMLNAVINHSSKIFRRCIAMPNLSKPITIWQKAKEYKNIISSKSSLEILIPCYLTDNIDLKNFEEGIVKKHFFGAKLYPVNATTNSSQGVSKIEKIFPALEILEKYNAPLLIHGEKIVSGISIFDREKYFIDKDLNQIIDRFSSLKIVLEHVSSSYGADFVAESKNNIGATITLHHLMLTKKDVFNDQINPHNYCMPVVKNENDLIALRNYACSGNKKFFLGTDSAPHDITNKEKTKDIKPGIYSSPIAFEMYTSIFEEENSLNNLEKFSSINGPKFYDLPINKTIITLRKEEWINEEFTKYKGIIIRNFLAGRKIKWKNTIVFNKL